MWKKKDGSSSLHAFSMESIRDWSHAGWRADRSFRKSSSCMLIRVPSWVMIPFDGASTLPIWSGQMEAIWTGMKEDVISKFEMASKGHASDFQRIAMVSPGWILVMATTVPLPWWLSRSPSGSQSVSFPLAGRLRITELDEWFGIGA
jgi:hypothetical protein